MFKYFFWIIKIGPSLIWNYLTWMHRYSRHPERYAQADRFARGQKLTRKILRRLKVDVEIRNVPALENDKSYYFVGNHTSFLDAIVTLAYLPIPIKFVGKIETAKMPFVNTMFRLIGGVLIERDNLKQEIKVMQQIRDSLKVNESSWLIFPEGTRKKDYHMPLLEYKSGAFKAPLQTNTTIIPFVLWGNQTVLPLKTRARRYKVILSYLDPVEPSGTTTELAEGIHAKSEAVALTLKQEYFDTQKLNKYGRKMITPPNEDK